MTSRLARALRLYLCIGLGIALVSCGGGGGSSGPPPPTGTVSGLVVSSIAGTGLAGVTVTGGGQTTTTSATGAYTLGGVGAGSAVVVKFALAGYAPGYQRVSVAANATTAAASRLTPVASTQSIAAASGGTVTLAGSTAQVVLPAAGLVDKATGAAAGGQVSVAITPIDPAADTANMPGDYSARGADGSAQTIESFGAVSIELSDAAGRSLDLASGQTATLRIPLASRSTAPPATIPLYYFDPASGLWVEQGTATLGGTAPNQYYEGSVSHFTLWNADQPTQTIHVDGCVNNADGSPATSGLASTDGVDYTGMGIAAVANGKFSVSMRKGGTADLYVDAANGISGVVVVGPSQTDISLTACLVLGPPGPPALVSPPLAVSVQEGNLAEFQVVARGAPPMRYQWLRNGTVIAGATQRIYVLYPAGAAAAGQYSVVVSNDHGSVTSDAVALTVAVVPPGLLSGPQSAAVTAGATETFTVTTLQAPQFLSFQWNRNGSPVAGATGASYTTPATTIANDGDRYSVTLSNSAGTVTSAEAVLTVQALMLPAITQNPASVSVTTGQTASFQVQASGSPPLAYQWLRNGTTLAGATAAAYTTPATVLGDSGAVYTVVVSNAAGSVSSTPATLSVADPSFAPAITQQPQGQAKLSGQTATFGVTATGTAPLAYQWQRNGADIGGATAASYTTAVLQVSDNNASFTVRVSNAQGAVTSNPALLTVTAAPVAPTIVVQPQGATLVAGLTATFTVTATGTAPLSYQWQLNGSTIGGATGTSYTTAPLVPGDSGAVFTVVVSNAVGSVTSSAATLTVTTASAGAGRYLVAAAGAPVTTTVNYANGPQSVDSRAILAAAAAAPTTTSVVEPAGQATSLFGAVFAGTAAGGQLTDLHTRYALYFKAGHLYKIDHQVAAGSPAGVQLSTLSPADVCSAGAQPDLAYTFGSDLADATRNWVFIAAPVAGICTSPSNSYRAVRMSMGSADAALSVGEPVAVIYDGNAAISGYIVRNGSTFQKLDADLAHPTTLFSLTPSAFRSYDTSFGATAPGIWMFVNAGQLYAYDLAGTASAPTVVATLQTGEQVGSIEPDGSSAYVALTGGSTGAGFRIIRVSDTLAGSPVYSASAVLAQFSLTPTRIVMLTRPDAVSLTTTSVTSVLRDGTGPVGLGGTGSTGFYTLFAYTAGENVFLEEAALSAMGVPTGVQTRIIASDGSNAQTLAGTAIAGVMQAPSAPLVRTVTNIPYAVLLVDNVAADFTVAGGSLRSLIGATRAPLLSYGRFPAAPATAFPATIDPIQYGGSGLYGLTASGIGAASDLYFFDSASANSLARLTTFLPLSLRSPAPAAALTPARRGGSR